MGKVFLVGAGPGDPELLTVRAARLLREADLVLHDALVSSEILALISPRAQVVDIGKRCATKLLTQQEINALLIRSAADADTVVRLKGGDPSIFGRAGEEIEALVEAGISFEVVPGITSALASGCGWNFSHRPAIRFQRCIHHRTLSSGYGRDCMEGTRRFPFHTRHLHAWQQFSAPARSASSGGTAAAHSMHSGLKGRAYRPANSLHGPVRAPRKRLFACTHAAHHRRVRSTAPCIHQPRNERVHLPTESFFHRRKASQLNCKFEEIPMSEENKIATTAARLGLSLDVWAVFAAFLLALLVRVGVLKHISW